MIGMLVTAILGASFGSEKVVAVEVRGKDMRETEADRQADRQTDRQTDGNEAYLAHTTQSS